MCLSGLKGRISAGDYREETIVEVKGDFVSWALSLYVFMDFEVHHSCQVCLDQLLQLHLFQWGWKWEKYTLISSYYVCVQYNYFKTNSPVSNDYCTERPELFCIFTGILMWSKQHGGQKNFKWIAQVKEIWFIFLNRLSGYDPKKI